MMVRRSVLTLWIAASVALLLGACGGPPGVPPGGGPPGGGQPPDDVSTAQPGTLEIVIDGVPADVTANVRVSGPGGFTQRLTTSTVLSQLTPGDYDVMAFGVARDDVGVAPRESTFTVTVTDSAGASVRVVYEELDMRPSARSRPVGAATAALLVGASSSTLQRLSVTDPVVATGGTLVFAQSDPFLTQLQAGDVISVGLTDVTPQGFIGTVRAVRFEGDGSVVVEADEASLEDAIDEGVVPLRQRLEPSDVAVARAYFAGVDPFGTPDGVARANDDGRFCPIAESVDLLPDSDSTLELDGSLCFSIDVDFSVVIRLFGSNEVSFIATVEEEAQIELSGEASMPFLDESFVLVDYWLTPITIPVGPVPVILTPVISVIVNAKGELMASFSTGVEQSLTFSAGLRYRNGSWEQIRPRLEPDFNYTPLTFDAGFDVSAGIRPQFAMRLYGAVGPTLAMTAIARAKVRPLSSPMWQLFFGFDLRAGVEFTVLRFINVSFSAELFKHEWEIAQGDGGLRGPPVITSLTAAPSTVVSGGSSTLAWLLAGGEPTSLTLNPGVGDVLGQSEASVAPSTTTTYTLTAANAEGSDSRSVTLTVGGTPPPTTGIASRVNLTGLPVGNWHVTILYPSLLTTGPYSQVGSSAAVTANGDFSLDLSTITPPPVSLQPPNVPTGVTVDPTTMRGAGFSLILFDDANGNQQLDAGERLYELNDPANTFGIGALVLNYADRAHTIIGTSQTDTGSTVIWDIDAAAHWGRTIYRTAPGDAVEISYDNTLSGLTLPPGRTTIVGATGYDMATSDHHLNIPLLYPTPTNTSP